MGLRVVGAGLGRTGTHSLKLALERLLGGPCYHMLEVFEHREHVPIWQRAVDGDEPDWDTIFGDFTASVDWPAAAFWVEHAAAYPDAVILLSTRDAEGWWNSASRTIFEATQLPRPDDPPEMVEWHHMVMDLFSRRFTPEWRQRDAAIEAFERHNAAVRSGAPKERLVEWRPGDGWQPLCDALALPVPAEPFPHVNTTAEFRAMSGLDAPDAPDAPNAPDAPDAPDAS